MGKSDAAARDVLLDTISRALDKHGHAELLETLGVLGIVQPGPFWGSTPYAFAVGTTLRSCVRREIGEAKDESKISVQVKFLPKLGNRSDRIDLVDEHGKVVYTWRWFGPKANDGATWTGKWTGKVYLHFKGRDNKQNVKYEVDVIS